ncbi:uncharacterized protein [Euwallacea fornicatus]|uniref:uncharacterized protein n=1 Tax=Euwallacea fornicatus TaxID=995702 RepID=UPI00338DFDEB
MGTNILCDLEFSDPKDYQNYSQRLVVASCYLHNFLRRKVQVQYVDISKEPLRGRKTSSEGSVNTSTTKGKSLGMVLRRVNRQKERYWTTPKNCRTPSSPPLNYGPKR